MDNKKSKIKNENFFQINGWMTNELKLKGVSLMLYAIIFGFTQDGETQFEGSRQYLCDFTGVSKPTVDKALNELIESNLIIKISETKNSITFNKYKANLDMLDFTTSKETLSVGSKETLSNNNNLDNKDINNINNKNINVLEKEEKEKEIYDYYLDQAIKLGFAKKHTEMNDNTKKIINKYLKEYDVDVIKQTITRYFQVISDKKYYFDTYWNPLLFFKQKNAFNDFLEDGVKWVNYCNFNSKPKTYKQVNGVEYEELPEGYLYNDNNF